MQTGNHSPAQFFGNFELFPGGCLWEWESGVKERKEVIVGFEEFTMLKGTGADVSHVIVFAGDVDW